MIDARELRIGNWVWNPDFEPGKKLYFKISAIASSEIQATPIPLTPEILEKCGIKLGEWIWENSYKITVAVGVEGFDITVRNCAHSTELTITYVKFLHQLQNLYFALTGQELTINL